MAAAEPGRWVTLDAMQPVESIQAQMRSATLARLA